MKIFTNLFLTVLLSLILISCGKKVDSPGLINDVQKHIDDIISQGYQIDNVNIYGKDFSDDGEGGIGEFKLLFVKAVSPDKTIGYMANFSYTENIGSELRFHGYPTDFDNKVKTDITYTSQPNFPEACAKLDEMKQMIPEGFKYRQLLGINYRTDTDGAYYEFKMQLKPTTDDQTHPNVKQQKKSYVKYTHSRNRKRFGGTKDEYHTKSKSIMEHTITFRLKDNHIEIK